MNDNRKNDMAGRVLSIPLAEYLRDPAPAPSLSASSAHLLLTRSARHAWLANQRLNPAWRPQASDAMDLGTIAHGLLLENDLSRLVSIDADDWRTKAAKDARDQARADGKVPLLASQILTVQAMVIAAKDAIASAPEIRLAWESGKPEQTLLWSEDGIWCRSRPDWLTNDSRLLIDYKTTSTSAEPDTWARGPMLAMGYDVQAAFGLRGIKALRQPHDCSFVFMVQETEPPYAVSFVGLSPAYEEFATQKMLAALAAWRFCLTTDRWSGYPTRVSWADPPAWALMRWALMRWDDKHATATSDGTVDQL